MWDNIFKKLNDHNPKPLHPPIFFKIDNAKQKFIDAFTFFLKTTRDEEFKWVEGYELVTDWLSDNKGKGIFIYGKCGLGKTMIIKHIIPAILLEATGKIITCVDATDSDRLVNSLNHRILAIDDIGVEEPANFFGNKRVLFSEIVDRAEKNNNLLMCSANLGGAEIQSKYGERTVQRVVSTMQRIELKGKTQRF